MSTRYQTIIIGAGPTGLGAAYRLEQLGIRNYVLLEGTDRPGGLAASYTDDVGFTWDLGGHVHFSHYDTYDRMIEQVLGGDRYVRKRQAWIWFERRFIPYPFQHNLHHLDEADRKTAVEGLRNIGVTPGAAPNFQTWIERTFGSGMAGLFMVPYNEKVWGYPLETLSADWIQDRVAQPTVGKNRGPGSEGRDEQWGPNRYFFYPRTGGTGAIWARLAAQLDPKRFVWNAQVVEVDLHRRHVTLAGGQNLRYDLLVSSMPLDLLTHGARGVPRSVADAANQLVYSSVHVVGIGLQGPIPASLVDKGWIYIPQSDVPFHRVTILSNYSPHNVPPGGDSWSLLVEACETRHRPVQSEGLIESVIAALRQQQLIPARTGVLSKWHRRLERGYPTPFLRRNSVLADIVPALERFDVYSRGRFGAWRYEVSNQDHSFMQGFEVVNRLMTGGDEPTLRQPDLVNQRVSDLSTQYYGVGPTHAS